MSGVQTFGSSTPAFASAPVSPWPSGVGLSGTGTCTRVSTGANIDASLPAGSYTVDASSCGGLSLTGKNAANYTLSLAGGTFTVEPLSLLVSVSGSETFGSPTPPAFTANPPSGLPAGVTLSGFWCTRVNAATIAASLPVGSYTIDASSCGGLTLIGANAANYALSLVGGTFTVNPAQIPVTVSGSQTFGSSTPPSFNANPLSDLPSGVGLSGTARCSKVRSGATIAASLAAGSYFIDPGSCSGLGLQGVNATNYALSLAGGFFTVARADLPVTVSGSETVCPPATDCTSSPTFTAAPTSGSLPSRVTLTIGTCTTVDSEVSITSSLLPGSYTILATSCTGFGLGGANAADYTLRLVGGTFTAQPVQLQVMVSGDQGYCGTSQECDPQTTFTTAPTSGSLPSGVTVVPSTVTVVPGIEPPATCTTVDSGTLITGSLPGGNHTIDAGSCSGWTLGGTNAPYYALSLVGGTFFVAELG